MPIDDAMYDDETAHRRQMWRHIRSAVTLLALVVIVVGAAWFSWRNVTDPATTSGAVSGPTCAPSAPAKAPAPKKITINVYNATSRDGLAAEVAKQMEKRGFKIGDIANDPLNNTVTGPAEVRTSLQRQAWASVVMGHVARAEYVPDERESDTVDLVLGDGFEALVKADAATPFTSASLPVCGPSPASSTPTGTPTS